MGNVPQDTTQSARLALESIDRLERSVDDHIEHHKALLESHKRLLHIILRYPMVRVSAEELRAIEEAKKL